MLSATGGVFQHLNDAAGMLGRNNERLSVEEVGMHILVILVACGRLLVKGGGDVLTRLAEGGEFDILPVPCEGTLCAQDAQGRLVLQGNGARLVAGDRLSAKAHDGLNLIFIGEARPDIINRETADLRHFIGHDLEHPFHKVRTPIIDGASRNIFVAAPPAVWLSIPTVVRLPTEGAPDLGQVLHNRENIGVPVAIMVGGGDDLLFLGGGNELVALVNSDTEWLFDDHVTACLNTLEGDGGVDIVGQDDHEQLDVALGEHLVQVCVGLDAREVLLSDFQAGFIEIANGSGDKALVANQFIQVLAAHIEGATIANRSDFDFFHDE